MMAIDPGFAAALDHYQTTGAVAAGLVPGHVDAGSSASDFRALAYLDTEGAAPVFTTRPVGFEDWTASASLDAEAVGWENWTGNPAPDHPTNQVGVA